MLLSKMIEDAITTDWPMFWVQIAVGVITLVLAGVSVFAALSAAKTSRKANELSEKSTDAMEESVGVASRMLELEARRNRATSEKEQREQASRVWVSMIVVPELDPDGKERLTYGVMQIRNSSDRPIRNMTIESRGRSGKQKLWFPKEVCEVPIVFPGDTIIRSRTSTTDWDIPKTYFPYFSERYHHAVGPKDDPHYVTSVSFDDADGKRWKLENGHCLTPGE